MLRIRAAAAVEFPEGGGSSGVLILLAQQRSLLCSKTSLNLLTGEVDFSRALTYPFTCFKKK